MELAKRHLDAGFFCSDLESDRDFWHSQIKLEFQGTLELGETLVAHPTTQYRYAAGGSIVKVNHYQGELPHNDQEPSGYHGVAVASDVKEPQAYKTLSGEAVNIVPNGFDDITGIGISVISQDPEKLLQFYTDIMEFEKVGPRKIKAGETVIFVDEGEGGTETSTFSGTGFRYMTVHVVNADIALKGISNRGGTISMEPIDYGKIARLGFVTDPDGNWIEVAHVNR